MNFSEWLWLVEALEIAPAKIEDLKGKALDNMTPQELYLLAKWHGVRPISDFSMLKRRIRNARTRIMRRSKRTEPTPEEVRSRVKSILMRQGRRGDKWLSQKDKGNLFGNDDDDV